MWDNARENSKKILIGSIKRWAKMGNPNGCDELRSVFLEFATTDRSVENRIKLQN